jgi:hypothetical protein
MFAVMNGYTDDQAKVTVQLAEVQTPRWLSDVRHPQGFFLRSRHDDGSG